MSLFQWIEGKLEQLDPSSSKSEGVESANSDLEKTIREAQILQEQVLQLKSDLRTSRNYAEQQLAVGLTQARETAYKEEKDRLEELVLTTNKRMKEVSTEFEGLERRNLELKQELEEERRKTERLEAIIESCGRAEKGEEYETLAQASETIAQLRVLLECVLARNERNKVTQVQSKYEALTQKLTEQVQSHESVLRTTALEMTHFQLKNTELESQIRSLQCTDESLTEAKNISALNDHLQAKQRYIEELLSEKTVLMLQLDRQTKENLALIQSAAVAQTKEKTDSISSLRLFRGRMWLRKPCEAIDRCFRGGLDHVRDNPLSRLGVLMYWLMVQLYILLAVMNSGSPEASFLSYLWV